MLNSNTVFMSGYVQRKKIYFMSSTRMVWCERRYVHSNSYWLLFMVMEFASDITKTVVQRIVRALGQHLPTFKNNNLTFSLHDVVLIIMTCFDRYLLFFVNFAFYFLFHFRMFIQVKILLWHVIVFSPKNTDTK